MKPRLLPLATPSSPSCGRFCCRPNHISASKPPSSLSQRLSFDILCFFFKKTHPPLAIKPLAALLFSSLRLLEFPAQQKKTRDGVAGCHFLSQRQLVPSQELEHQFYDLLCISFLLFLSLPQSRRYGCQENHPKQFVWMTSQHPLTL